MGNDHNPFKKEAEDEIKNELKDELIENDKKDDTISTDETETVETSEADEAKVEENNDELNEKYEDLNNKYLRLAADFDNYRKRTVQEKEDLIKYAASEVLKKLTTVLDTFERAQQSLAEIEDTKTVKESYEVAFKQLIDTLKKMGMDEIEALNQPFDPNLFEAVTQIETDEVEPDHVAVVMQKGYKLHDKVLRPALVGVAKPKAEEN